MLHEAHTNLKDINPISKTRVLNATYTILNSVYGLLATTYDVTLLPNQVVLYWLSAARILTRLYRNCLEKNEMDNAAQIKSEIDTLR
jgi:hypothetical protein